jgi:hypothetical protein
MVPIEVDDEPVAARSDLEIEIDGARVLVRGILFLKHDRIEVDNNMLERQMRPIAIGHRNSRLVNNGGGARSWAVLASLLQAAKLNGLDPFIWRNDVLTRIVFGEVKNNDLGQLLAWNWKPAVPVSDMDLAA